MDISKVVSIFGDDELPLTYDPQPLEIPKESPAADKIYDFRRKGRMTQKEAAKTCGVTLRTWRRWENGKSKMPKSVWGWFKIITTGGLATGGPDWEEWGFYKGKLYSPEGWGRFTPGDLRSWPYIHAQLSELRRTIKKLEEQLAEAQRLQDKEIVQTRNKAVGQFDILMKIMAQLKSEYEKTEDPLLQQIGGNLFDLMMKTADTGTVPLIKSTMDHSIPTG